MERSGDDALWMNGEKRRVGWMDRAAAAVRGREEWGGERRERGCRGSGGRCDDAELHTNVAQHMCDSSIGLLPSLASLIWPQLVVVEIWLRFLSEPIF